ncbi:MAG: hypothetical protein WBP29_01190 [Candidatus Zixiibacteriota bacterium]
MSYRKVASILIVFVCLILGSLFAAIPEPAKIDPTLSLRLSVSEQPFGGEMKFLSTPALGQACTVRVVLTSHRQISQSTAFRMMKAEVYNMTLSPDTVVWEAPIDSGATKTFEFEFTPTLVGSHRLSIARKSDKTWLQLATLQININEDGKTICAGPTDLCKDALIPPHPSRADVPMLVEFPINELEPRRTQDRHFSSKFKFTAAKAMKDSAFVDFELECHVGLYTQVQFQVETSTNISLSKLPESWGDKAGPAPGYRLYNGRIGFVPQRAGLTLFDFKVIGKRPSTRGNERTVTDFPIHLVIGENGEILFAGNFDPYTRFKEATDPMLGTLRQLLEIGNRDYRTRIALSMPDFRGQEIDARDGMDTSKTDTTPDQK